MASTFYDLIDACFADVFGQEPMARFLREHGIPMAGEPLPPGIAFGKPRQAFRNAWDLTLKGEVDYFEGYAWDPVCGELPFHHAPAWGVDRRTGAVRDTTWRDAAGAVYLGVHVPTGVLLTNLEDSGVFGVLDKGRGFEHGTADAIWGWVDHTLPRDVRSKRIQREHRRLHA
jgi:hypothetical protein